jgi:TolC family type I secretion outer membrane protein
MVMAVGTVFLWPVGGVRAQTLEMALAAAYSTNPTLLSQRATVRAADEEVPQALSNLRPSLELEGDYGASEVRNAASSGTSSRNPRSLSLSFKQPLYRGGRTVAATRLAENSVLAERARLDAVEQRVLLQAATAYMDVVRDQAVMRLNINNEQVLLRQLEATRDRFEVGEVTRTDVAQAEARLARATADRIQAKGDLEAGRATYRKVMGNAPGELRRPAPPVDLPASGEEAVRIAAKENPRVISAQYDGLASRDNVEEIRGELLPTLDLTGSASKAYDTAGENSRIGTYKATVTLTIPLYQSGSVYSRLRQARQRAAAQRLDVAQERRDATEEATRAWEGLQTAKARIESFRTQYRASVVALEGVEREASVGSRTVLDILDAEQEKLDAEVSLALAQRDEMVAIFELKSALGQLTARRMNLPVDLYDPTGHYWEVRWKWFGGGNSGAAVGAVE